MPHAGWATLPHARGVESRGRMQAGGVGSEQCGGWKRWPETCHVVEMIDGGSSSSSTTIQRWHV